MKVLVTGATSGLGRMATETLLRTGIEVRATGRNPVAGASLLGIGAQFVSADLTNASRDVLYGLLQGVDAVWHCAALSSPWGSATHFNAINVTATQALVEAAGDNGIARFVHISTPGLYFNFTHRIDVNEEALPKGFVNHYVRTKAAAEALVQAAVKRYPQTRFVVLRPRALFGPHDRVVLPRLIRLLRQGRGVLRLPRGGDALQDMTYTGNAVQAMWLASTADVSTGSVFNITNQEPIRLRELITRLCMALSEPADIRPIPYPVIHAAAVAMECAGRLTGREPTLTRYGAGILNYDMTLCTRRARQELGYTPLTPQEDGIAITAEWFRRHGYAAHH